MRALRAMVAIGLAAAAPLVSLAAPPSSAHPAATEAATTKVIVMLPLVDAKERIVTWKDGLTLDQAIQTASPRIAWKEAWRFRENFWSRRNPHSFWARLFAGERATGFTYFPNAEGKASLRPGDRIYVDLAPID